VLAQAREIEEQLAAEGKLVTTLASTVANSQAVEAETAQRLDALRDKVASLETAVAEARNEIAAAENVLTEARHARADAEAKLTAMHARIESLSGTNGLTATAVKRLVERRLADRIRQAPSNA